MHDDYDLLPELSALENTLQAAEDAFRHHCHEQGTYESLGAVNRQMAGSLESFLPDTAPLAMFTERPSRCGIEAYSAALESRRAGLIASLIAAIGAIVVAIVKWWKKNRQTSTALPTPNEVRHDIQSMSNRWEAMKARPEPTEREVKDALGGKSRTEGVIAKVFQEEKFKPTSKEEPTPEEVKEAQQLVAQHREERLKGYELAVKKFEATINEHHLPRLQTRYMEEALGNDPEIVKFLIINQEHVIDAIGPMLVNVGNQLIDSDQITDTTTLIASLNAAQEVINTTVRPLQDSLKRITGKDVNTHPGDGQSLFAQLMMVVAELIKERKRAPMKRPFNGITELVDRWTSHEFDTSFQSLRVKDTFYLLNSRNAELIDNKLRKLGQRLERFRPQPRDTGTVDELYAETLRLYNSTLRGYNAFGMRVFRLNKDRSQLAEVINMYLSEKEKLLNIAEGKS